MLRFTPALYSDTTNLEQNFIKIVRILPPDSCQCCRKWPVATPSYLQFSQNRVLMFPMLKVDIVSLFLDDLSATATYGLFVLSGQIKRNNVVRI